MKETRILSLGWSDPKKLDELIKSFIGKEFGIPPDSSLLTCIHSFIVVVFDVVFQGMSYTCSKLGLSEML